MGAIELRDDELSALRDALEALKSWHFHGSGYYGDDAGAPLARVLEKVAALEPYCNHDAPAVVDGVCECGARV